MYAITAVEAGGSEVLKYGQHPDPVPGAGELLIDVAAAGVNFIDIYQREGRYAVDVPFVPGREGAGVVAEVGADVTDFEVGDRVAWASGVLGSYATKAVIPAARAVPVPGSTDLEIAAAAMVQGMTAHYLTHSTYQVRPGDTVLVHAAAGGTGLLLTQMVRMLGGRVIGTVSSLEKEQRARQAGANEVIRYEGFAKAVRDLTNGEGVPVVYDGVGRATFDGSLASLRTRGLMVLYGGASGPVEPFDPMRLLEGGGLFLTRPTLIPSYLTNRQELLWRAGDVLRWVSSGKLRVHIGRRYPLADARTAHEDLEHRRSVGKLLLIPEQSENWCL
ncbi:quinone oxidoreductase family protein [Streptosporangium sp. NBC_01469]|uniref:quinone oxidoreductase family protein n=1 Tax=Streptosporangium sp. NBC_01469 TaxID=2903898 RepID=UPI002E2CA812|nr:quinone oxidoreductase [Streptosporangium sp. NBC_01469]